MAGLARLTPRRPRPDLRLDVVGALLATVLAGLVYLVALSLEIVPPPGYNVVLFAWAPPCAAVAAAVLWVRARAEQDHALRWVAAGLIGSTVAIILQLVALPIVAPSGGPFGTSGNGTATLYLLFHWTLIGAALAGALGTPTRWRRPLLVVALALALLFALDVVPTPALMNPDQSFTRLTVLLEIATAVLAAVVTVVWVLRSGRNAPALRGWVAVALALMTYELLLNAMAGRRYNPTWWASLSMRVATYGVLALAGVVTVLIQLYRQEHYTETELTRREDELVTSLAARDQLLASAERLARAAASADVARVITDAAAGATGATGAAVVVPNETDGTVRLLAATGWDPPDEAGRLPATVEIPTTVVLRTGRARYTRSGPQTRAVYPDLEDLTGVIVPAGTVAVAALPLRVASALVGALVVTDTRRREWPTGEREILRGLADQAAQALGRAHLYERQRATAEALQRGMLPRSLPSVPAVAVVARYLPAAAGMTVGGDWYDCIPVPDGRVILVVGDVMGKGAQAAAVMGRARTALHALATVDPSPGAVLSGLDNLVMELTPDGFFTLLYVLVNPAAGTAEIAGAGHLPLLLAAPDGTVRPVAHDGSPAIGIAAAQRTATRVHIAPGSTMALFTDGLVEDRGTGIGPGTDRVARALGAHRDEDLPALADRLLTVNATGGHDDTCLLLARIGTPPGAATTPASPPATTPASPPATTPASPPATTADAPPDAQPRPAGPVPVPGR